MTNSIIKFARSEMYIWFTFMVIMPLNGLIAAKNPVLAIVLIASQIPWFYTAVIKRIK